LERAIQILLKETDDMIPIHACRNLWNLAELRYYNEAAFKELTGVVMRNQDRLNDVDVANCVKAFSTFQHLDYDALEMLLKQSIRHATEMKLFSLAVILDSFAELDIRNP
jgi:hypothetical protein